MNNSEHVSCSLVIGSDLDSLLFKIAIHYAEYGKQVWFISPKMFNKTPANIKQPDKEVLQLITFIYLKTFKDLMAHLHGVHLWPHPPFLIILTGFEDYCNFLSQNYESPVSSLLMTSLLDSARFCSLKNNTRTLILIGCNREILEQVNKLKFIIDLYLNEPPKILNNDNDEKMYYDCVINNYLK